MKRKELVTNIGILVGVLLLMTLFAQSWGRYYWISVVLGLLGIMLTILARWSPTSADEVTEISYSNMNPTSKKVYLFGYCLLFVALLLSCL